MAHVDEDLEDVTDLYVEVDASAVAAATHADAEPRTLDESDIIDESPADGERPTAVVAPETLARELARSRKHSTPEPVAPPPPPARAAPPTAAELQRPIVTPSEPFPLGDAARLEALMSASIEQVSRELPTAPQAFAPTRAGADAAHDVAAGAGRTLEIPRTTLAQVLEPRGPKGTVKIVAPTPSARQGVPAPAPAPAAARRSSTTLAMVVMLAVILGAAATALWMAASQR